MSDHIFLQPISVESLPDFEGIRERFEEGFTPFIAAQKARLASRIIREELQSHWLANHGDFLARVTANMADDTLDGQRFVFIALNPKYLEQVSV